MTDPRRPDEPEDPEKPDGTSDHREDPEGGKPGADDGLEPETGEPGHEEPTEPSAAGTGAADAHDGREEAREGGAGAPESSADAAGTGDGGGGSTHRAEQAAAADQPGGVEEAGGAGGDAAAAAGEAGATGAAPPGEPQRRNPWWLWVGVALVVIAVGGLAAGLVQLSGRIQELEREVAEVPERRSEALAPLARQDQVQSAVRRLESELGERIQTLEQQGSEATRALTERIDQLEEAFATVRELAGRNQVDWRMAEVHYLLAVSARRLAIAGDRRGAIAALEAADRSLSALGDVRLLELRASIIEDITAIRQVQPADVEGIALRLQALLERIPELSPARTERRVEAEGDAEGDAGGGSAAGWWAALRERVSRYIVVRRQPDAAGPARPQPEASLPASSRLAFALSEARQAALRQDADAYDSAVERARRVLDEAFAADSPTTQRFADTLERLAERAVVTTYPDLTTTLEQAQRVAARLRTEREAAMPAEEEPASTQEAAGTAGTERGAAAPGPGGQEGSPESGGGGQ